MKEKKKKRNERLYAKFKDLFDWIEWNNSTLYIV